MAGGTALSFARNRMMVLRTAAEEIGRAPMSSLTNNLTDMLSQGGEARRGQALTEASMAAGALVAMADGDVSFAERAVVDQGIDALAEREATEPHAAAAAFDEFVDGMRRNSSQGRGAALRAVQAFGVRPDAMDGPAIVLRIADAVARADGGVTADEADVIGEIAALLDAPPPAN